MTSQRTKSASLTAAVTAVVFLALFCALAWFIAHGGASNDADLAIWRWLGAHRDRALDIIMLVATYLCSWPIVVAGAVACLCYWALLRAWEWIAALAFALAGNVALNSVIKPIVQRVRPDQSHVLLPANGASFPSGHTFSAFALYGVLALFIGFGLRSNGAKFVLGAITVVFVALVGVSRVYVGAHWPTDVVGSSLLGTAWLSAILAFVLWRRTEVLSTETWPLRIAVTAAWLAFTLAYAWAYPLTQNAGSIGEGPGVATLDLGCLGRDRPEVRPLSSLCPMGSPTTNTLETGPSA